MTAKNRAVFGIYSDRPAVEEAITHFLRAGFRKADISALFPENPGSKDLGHEKNSKAPEGVAVGGFVGAVILGVLSWLIVVGWLNIPALSSLASCGPALGTLAGVGAGGIVGSIIGGLIGLSIPEYEARRWAGRIREGGVLVSVHCDNRDWAGRARTIFEDSGAQDIATAAEKTGDFGNAERPMPRIRTITHSDDASSVSRDDTVRVAHEEKPTPSLSSRS